MLQQAVRWEHKGSQTYTLTCDVPGVGPDKLHAAVGMLLDAGAHSASAGFVRKAALSPDLQTAFDGLQREALVTRQS